MNTRVTAIVEHDGDGHAAICPKVDVSNQGETILRRATTLPKALTLFFETAAPDEVDRRLRRRQRNPDRSRS